MLRRFDPRRIKIHRSYTVEDAARTLGSHKNSVRRWIKCEGLTTIDDARPAMIHGRTLRDFLIQRRESSRCRCRPGEIYCLRCRAPKSPAGGMIDYLPMTATSGNLRGICPDCRHQVYRRVGLSQLSAICAGLAQPDELRHTPSPGHRHLSQRASTAGQQSPSRSSSDRSGFGQRADVSWPALHGR